MQQERPKPEATAQAAEGTVEHAHGNGAGQAPEGNERPDDAMPEGAQCACEDETDFDYMVTPFPEHISKYLFFNSLYLPWILLSVALAVIRVSAMAICGEETGRFPINIAFAALPGILATLIIAYSKRTEKTTKIFCGMANRKNRDAIISIYERHVRIAFNNTGMMAVGLIFAFVALSTLENKQLYPTPSHNIRYRAMAERGAIPDEDETPFLRRTLYDKVTFPAPTFDENIDGATYREMLAFDPEWYDHSPKLKQIQDVRRTSGPLADNSADTPPSGWEERKKWEEKRAARLIPPLRSLYLLTTPLERWRISQGTYRLIMVPLSFMSGAMCWCLGGIIWLTWSLGRRLKKGTQIIWQITEVGAHPGLPRIVQQVGKNLWHVAIITGAMYTVIVICLYIAQADTQDMITAGMFSPLIIGLFILPQYNLHKLLANAKSRRIAALDDALSNILRGTGHTLSEQEINTAHRIMQMQKSLTDTSDWPFDLKSLGMIVSSVIVPILMTIFTLFEHF